MERASWVSLQLTFVIAYYVILSDSSPEDRCACNNNNNYFVEEITTFQNVRAVCKIPVCQMLEVGLGPDLLMHFTLMHWFSTCGS